MQKYSSDKRSTKTVFLSFVTFIVSVVITASAFVLVPKARFHSPHLGEIRFIAYSNSMDGIGSIRFNKYVANTNHRFRNTIEYLPSSIISSSLCAVSAPTALPIVEQTKLDDIPNKDTTTTNIVLVCGFESFNRDLYNAAASKVPNINLKVFADKDIRQGGSMSTPQFEHAMKHADAFLGSLIFDYDDALVVKQLLPHVKGPRFIFESADEIMSFNKIGTFQMGAEQGSVGPPPAVKAILSKFSSGREEDKLLGYIKMLKVGPDLLKYIPGDNKKVADLRTWLEVYRYWNQGGRVNFTSMLQLISNACRRGTAVAVTDWIPPPLQVTPDLGLLHPLLTLEHGNSDSKVYMTSPAEYLKWRLSDKCKQLAKDKSFHLAPSTAPRVAFLLFRKHVITEQRYIFDLLTIVEKNGIIPIPIFINGVEAHTVVRDLLTSRSVSEKSAIRSNSNVVAVDAVVSTIGFPLVGGPAGSMEAGRNIAVAKDLLRHLNVPYFIAAPLLLQSISSWRSQGVQGLQSVVLYALPELDGAIDTCVLGGLVGDKIALVPERVRKLTSRIKGWVELRQTPPEDRRIAISIYGFPPNVGAVGTAALLDVPQSLENLLRRLAAEGYDVGGFEKDSNGCGESLVAALAVLSENPSITAGADNMQKKLNDRIQRAVDGDPTTAATLAKPGGGLGGAVVSAFDVSRNQLDETLGEYMASKVRKHWGEKSSSPGVSSKGNLVVSGLQLGNIWITVQPLLGVEGDPMRLLFERDLTPHPQYVAAYEWMKKKVADGGVGAQAVIHLGMHGTVEWLPGLPLGNDKRTWPDVLLGGLPNIYVYAANNPSESILAKRRGYGTLVSYNVPPYGRAGLYLDLANLKDLVADYRVGSSSGDYDKNSRSDLRDAIWAACERCELLKDVPLLAPKEGGESVHVSDSKDIATIPDAIFDSWIVDVDNYLVILQERLFSSGLHTLGRPPTDVELNSYLSAFYGEKLSDADCNKVISGMYESGESVSLLEKLSQLAISFFGFLMSDGTNGGSGTDDASIVSDHSSRMNQATEIAKLLMKNTEEVDSIVNALSGGYVPAAPGGDLLRDGASVLPTGRNIHALDPYRMPGAAAWARGQKAADEILRQHREANNGLYPETVAVTLWGLDAIKTRGESVAILLALVGAAPVKEGTGRVVRYDLLPLEEIGRPRIDILASMSGIFRDTFANIVDLLDDMFERAASAPNEPPEMNFIKKHAGELISEGVERPAARLFSNPPGDYGSMVNEVVGSGEWDKEESLGEMWKGRNVFSYGKNEGGGKAGTARPKVLEKLLSTTERVVQEIDSVEYGLTDIQEYYANTGALKKAAENRQLKKGADGKAKKVAVSIVEAFGGSGEQKGKVPVRDLQDTLRIEYRSKLLNPKWRDAMLKQGSGGAYEVSQRMTAMVGWAATDELDNFVFDQAAERYALDDEVAKKTTNIEPRSFQKCGETPS